MTTSAAGRSFDALIIGGGHNGLVTAAYLARAGLKVMVVERRAMLGGAAATEEVFPGFRVNTGAFDAGLFLPEIYTGLRLENEGLEFITPEAIAIAPQTDGPALTLWRDPVRAQVEIARFSKADAEKYPAYLRTVARFAEIMRLISVQTPPSIPQLHAGELLPWLPVALKTKRLGNRQMMELLRLLPMPVSDFLDEWFDTPLLKAALASAGVTGTPLGPKASGTAFMLLYQAMNAGPAGFRASRFVKGGMSRLSEALAQAARRYGAEICLGFGVARILLDGERVTGIELDSGEQIAAPMVVSSAAPRHTFFDLIGPAQFDVRFVREVKTIKSRGSMARVNLALIGVPSFTGAPPGDRAALGGHLLFCPSLESLERASDDAKYGRFSQQPFLDAAIPTLLDPSLAPPGQHLMTVNVQYAPYTLQDESWEQACDRLGERVVETLASYAPGIQELITARQVLTPLNLEQTYGLTGGNIYHGEMGLDQLLFMRPVAGYGRYRTPLDGLYLCGAGAHPGGGVTGIPGYNAAREILADLKSRH
ncbi:MAG: NAD(P)/FAD-dependent oxidoreductase [Chloroflexota bacterium]|nr:MAG: NAD(P)/FAD-dependent oxidoreductase [Chloroflexota bacterium]